MKQESEEGNSPELEAAPLDEDGAAAVVQSEAQLHEQGEESERERERERERESMTRLCNAGMRRAMHGVPRGYDSCWKV